MYELRQGNNVTPEFIRSRIKDEVLFRHYVGICPIEGPTMFRNPFRKDKKPTCSYGVVCGKWTFRDWSEDTYKDIFDVVQLKYQCNFPRALEIIAEDFDLHSKEPQYKTALRRSAVPEGRVEVSQFEVQVQPYTGTDMHYLHRHNITTEIAKKYQVFSVKHLHINGKLHYSYSNYNPALGYYFGSDGNLQHWKIYFYLNFKKNQARFLTNTNKLAGWNQLPLTGTLVVITKSLKDVMAFDSFNVPAVAPQGESIDVEEHAIQELRIRFDHVISLYDFDRTGVKAANKLRKQSGIPARFLTNGRFGTEDYRAKDISEYCFVHGPKQTQKLINHEIKTLLYETLTGTGYPSLSAALRSFEKAKAQILEATSQKQAQEIPTFHQRS